MACCSLTFSNPLFEGCQEKSVDVRQLIWPYLPAVLTEVKHTLASTIFVEIEKATSTFAFVVYYELPSVLPMINMLYLFEEGIILYKVSQSLLDILKGLEINKR